MNLYIILLFTIIIIFTYHEYAPIEYNVKHLIYGEDKSGLPTPLHSRKRIRSIIKSLPRNRYTLIDFGCGQGDFIKSVIDHPSLHTIVGVELDKKHVDYCKTRFRARSSVSIYHQNMIDYVFPPTPLILYMYEPLWCMNHRDAIPIYRSVLDRFPAHPNNFVLYISGVSPILDSSFFKEINCEILHHSRITRGLGWNGNHIYVLHKHVVVSLPSPHG